MMKIIILLFVKQHLIAEPKCVEQLGIFHIVKNPLEKQRSKKTLQSIAALASQPTVEGVIESGWNDFFPIQMLIQQLEQLRFIVL